MKKCKLIATITSVLNLSLYNLILITNKGELIILLENNFPDNFESIDVLIRYCVRWANMRGYNVDIYQKSGALWYDITFIDAIDKTLHKYPFMIE